MGTNNPLYLCEAYYQIYEPSEFDVAAEYFYEMGINEDGIDILIEELGVDELFNWVTDINEERAAKKRKGGKSYEEIKAEIDAKERSKAAKKASTTQEPSKPAQSSNQTQKSMAGRLGAALGGMVKKANLGDKVERAKQDIELTKKTAQTIGKAFGVGVQALNRASDSRLSRQARIAAKKVTRQGLKRHEKAMTAAGGALGRAAARVPAIRDTYRAGERFGRAMREEDYEYIVNYLLDEGYAETTEAAEAIVNCMSEEWTEEIVGEMLDENRGDKRVPSQSRAELRNARAGFQVIDPKSPAATEVRRREHKERRGMGGNIGGEGGSSYRYDDNSDRDYPSFRVRGRGRA